MAETGLAAQQPGGELISVEQHRAIQEVQASMVIAKKFPRDQEAAYLRITKACERFNLADQAEYAYPRGGKSVTGPSIRLAEALAQNWGNLTFGIRELSQGHGESEIEAFAWDLETNTRQVKTFKVPHKRYTKQYGNKDLTDPRDVYEFVANQGARRMRACILGIIPGDIVDAAVEKCRETVKKGVQAKPIADQIRATLKGFDAVGVNKEMIERRLGHGIDTTTAEELVELNNIGRSIKDNMTKREEWFDFEGKAKEQAKNLTEEIKKGEPTGEPPIYEVENTETPETVDPGPEGGHSGADGNPVGTKGKNIIEVIKGLKPGRSDASKEGFIKFIGERLEAIYALPSEQLAYVKTKYLDATEAELPELPSDGNVGETLAGEPTIDEQIDIKTDETLSAYELTENGWLSQSDFRKIMMGYAKGMPLDDYNLLMGSYTDSTDVPPNKREEVLRRFVKAGL